MTTKEFYEKWKPCDWSPIAPSEEEKNEFMADLEKVISQRIEEIKHG